MCGKNNFNNYFFAKIRNFLFIVIIIDFSHFVWYTKNI